MEVFIADNILKTFYKHMILGCYIKDRSLKDVGFIIIYFLYVNFTFINVSLQKVNLFYGA